jgi:hypothetical protein
MACIRKVVIFCAALVNITIIALLSALVLAQTFPPKGTMIFPDSPPMQTAGPETRFKVEVAYAAVGDSPYGQNTTTKDMFGHTLVPATTHPSTVLLRFTRISSDKFSSCDAVDEVFGVKISADTGTSEYYCFSTGTNNNQVFQHSDLSVMSRYVNNLVDLNLYRSDSGDFHFNWTFGKSYLSMEMGSAGLFAGQTGEGLANKGQPSSITVTAYRIGYVTMQNGSVSIYGDNSIDDVKTIVQLPKTGNVFLYDKLVSSDEVPQTLYRPITSSTQGSTPLNVDFILILAVAAVTVALVCVGVLAAKKFRKHSPEVSHNF